MLDSLKHLSQWLTENKYTEPKKEGRNHFIAYSQDKGSVSIRTIERESYQPHVNCVNRDKFELHKTVAKERGCSSLVYVMYLRGNGIQLIIPEHVVENHLQAKWFVVRLENVPKGESPLPGIKVRLI